MSPALAAIFPHVGWMPREERPMSHAQRRPSLTPALNSTDTGVLHACNVIRPFVTGGRALGIAPMSPRAGCFLTSGFMRFYTCRCCFWPPASYVCQQKRGHERRVRDPYLFYLFSFPGSSPTSSTSRCPACVTSETGPLLHGHVLRSVALWWGGGEAASCV